MLIYFKIRIITIFLLAWISFSILSGCRMLVDGWRKDRCRLEGKTMLVDVEKIVVDKEKDNIVNNLFC